jgi:predicted  nucleic acid-binding Zn-ribbon protein
MNPGSLGVLIPIIGMMIGFFVIFSRSDLGRALAQRISGGAGAASSLEGELRELRGEVDALRGELSETQERLDFTERMLAAGKQEG